MNGFTFWGDLFDVWPGTSEFLLSRFKPVVDVLKRLVDEGHELHYIEGNHDFRLGQFFESELKIEIHPDTHEEVWRGRRIYMAHGDLGNPRDLGYRALRYVLRHDATHAIARLVGAKTVYQIGSKSSEMSRNYQKRSPEIETAIRLTYRNAAERIFREGMTRRHHGPYPFARRLPRANRGKTLSIPQYRRLGTSFFTYLEFDGEEFLYQEPSSQRKSPKSKPNFNDGIQSRTRDVTHP